MVVFPVAIGCDPSRVGCSPIGGAFSLTFLEPGHCPSAIFHIVNLVSRYVCGWVCSQFVLKCV